jgi:hypothetical protein
MYNFLDYMVILLMDLSYRPETPPNTPQQAHAAARQNECENCHLDSPQHCQTPHHSGAPLIPPLQFNDVHIPPAPPVPGNGIISDDPFGPPPAPVQFNGQQYHHLPRHLAQQLQNLPPLAPAGCGHLVTVSVNASKYLFSLIENF